MTTQVTDHKGGVWSIAVPIPDNPLGHTLVHLLETDRGPVLIDTGWDDPDSWDTLVAGISACGFALADLHGVLITHHHPDHHGLSAKVREASGAWIAMHAADTAVVRRTREADPGQWLDYLTARLAAAGAPDGHLAAAAQGARQGARPEAARTGGRTAGPRHRPRRTARSAGTPGARHLDTRSHPGACVPPSGGGASLGAGPAASAGCSPATISCPASPRTSACTRTRRATGVSPRSRERARSGEPGGRPRPPGRLPRLPRTRRPARPRRGTARPPARLRRRRRPCPRAARPPRGSGCPGCGRCSSEPRTAWQLAMAMEWNRPWDQIPTPPAISPSRRRRPICAVW